MTGAKRDRAEYQREYRAKNREVLKAKKAERYLQTKEQVIAAAKRWAEANRGKTRESVRRWTARNREKLNAIASEYMRANPHKNRDKAARHRATRLQATPSWANSFFIKEIYHLAVLRAKALGGEWHVDHIVPLRSEIVCGLHCEANLRVIPAKVNLAKGNTYWPDMP